MEQLLEILSEIKEDVDFTTCTTLIDYTVRIIR